jgi:hypothetical protein
MCLGVVARREEVTFFFMPVHPGRISESAGTGNASHCETPISGKTTYYSIEFPKSIRFG